MPNLQTRGSARFQTRNSKCWRRGPTCMFWLLVLFWIRCCSRRGGSCRSGLGAAAPGEVSPLIPTVQAMEQGLSLLRSGPDGKPSDTPRSFHYPSESRRRWRSLNSSSCGWMCGVIFALSSKNCWFLNAR